MSNYAYKMEAHDITSAINNDDTWFLQAAIEQGFDVNQGILSAWGTTSLLANALLASKNEATKLLLDNGARCGLDSWRYEQYVERPQYFYNTYKQDKVTNGVINALNSPWQESSKIPQVLFHVWLTHPNSPREIFDEDLEVVLANQRSLQATGDTWQHIMLVNDKKLIPNTALKLEQHGIQVIEIEELRVELRLFDILQENIEQKKWGIAADILRYTYLEKFGGVYCDVNTQLAIIPTDAMHRHDFIGENFINNFIAAKAGHPILSTVVDIVSDNLSSDDLWMKEFNEGNMFAITLMSTYIPYGEAFFRSSNQLGNSDVMYIHNKVSEDEVEQYSGDIAQPSQGSSEFDIRCYHYFDLDQDELSICIGENYIALDAVTSNYLTWLE